MQGGYLQRIRKYSVNPCSRSYFEPENAEDESEDAEGPKALLQRLPCGHRPRSLTLASVKDRPGRERGQARDLARTPDERVRPGSWPDAPADVHLARLRVSDFCGKSACVEPTFSASGLHVSDTQLPFSVLRLKFPMPGRVFRICTGIPCLIHRNGQTRSAHRGRPGHPLTHLPQVNAARLRMNFSSVPFSPVRIVWIMTRRNRLASARWSRMAAGVMYRPRLGLPSERK